MMTKYNPQDFGKVVVLMGGDSTEREISLVTGGKILDALVRSGVDAYGLDVQIDVITQLMAMKPDRAFIALHGLGGEDGTIQGVLQYLGIMYTGSGVTGCAITMEKTLTKLIWQSVNIPTPPFRLVTNIEAAIEIMNQFGLPLCLKPTNNGSSAGVSKISEPEQLPDAFNRAMVYDGKAIIEPWIEGTEYTVGILGTSALPVIEIQTPRTFYDFNAKYKENTTNYICPCNLTPEKEQQLQEMALDAFQVTGCYGWGRVDLMEDFLGNFWFLEVNTVPGMTEHSLVPKAANVLGLTFDQLVLEILGLTLVSEAEARAVTA